MAEIELYDSVTHSNMPAKDKSSVLALLGQMTSGNSEETVLGMLLKMSLSGTVGAVLGVAQAELKDGLDYNKKVALDLVLAGLSGAGGMVFKSAPALKVAESAITVYSYRKIAALLASFKEKTPAEEPVAAE